MTPPELVDMRLTASLNRMQLLPAMVKAAIIVGGYAAALLIAVGVVAIYIDQTSGPDRDLSSGMYAFGDSLLFCAVFGVVSIIPTGLMLVVLRQSRKFWAAISVVALLVASTSVAEVVATVFYPLSTNLWVMLAFPRIFLSPFLAAAFGLAALFAPKTGWRWVLFTAAGMEAASSIYGFLHWFLPLFLSRGT